MPPVCRVQSISMSIIATPSFSYSETTRPVHVSTSSGHTCSLKRVRNERMLSAPSQSVAYVPSRPACSIPTEKGDGYPAASA